MSHFQNPIFMLKIYAKNRNQLLAVFYQSLHLRRFVSYLVRIIDISIDDIHEMKLAGQNYSRHINYLIVVSCPVYDILLKLPLVMQNIYLTN